MIEERWHILKLKIIVTQMHLNQTLKLIQNCLNKNTTIATEEYFDEMTLEIFFLIKINIPFDTYKILTYHNMDDKCPMQPGDIKIFIQSSI